MTRAHLAVHTPWSLLRGVSSVPEICAAARRDGIETLGLVDHMSLAGAVHAWRACRAAGIQLLLGATLVGPDGRCAVLARTRDGYTSLCRAVTACCTEEDVRLAAVLARRSMGLAVLAADRGTEETLASVLPRHRLRRARHPDVYAATTGAARHHRVLRAIAGRAALSAVPPNATEVLTAAPGSDPETRELVRACSFDLERDLGCGRARMPRVPGDGLPLARLERCCRAGLDRLLGTVPAPYDTRLRRELGVIGELGFASYFLVLGEVAAFCRRAGIAHCGRGSAAGSLVAWSLGLSQVDPLRHHLLFERFLDRERADWPDVDLDVDWRRRDTVIRALQQRHGVERVARVGTHVRFGPRGAVREVGKVLGLDPDELSRVSRALPPDRLLDAEAVAEAARLHGLDLHAEPWRTVFDHARALQSLPHHLGVHPTGVVVDAGPLADRVPLFRSASGEVATQWDKDALAVAGLVKIDLPGNRSLGVIYDAQVAAGAHPPTEPDTDDATRALLRRGDTVGCFYVESPAMRSLLRRMRCESFDDLVAASSIVRPGVARSGMLDEYLRRRDGQEDWTTPDLVNEVLAETHGLLVYQEDIVRLAHRVCGLPLSDADRLRRALTRPAERSSLPSWRRAFLAGAGRSGLSRAEAEQLWQQVASFAGYAFCKAHSASFARVSLQTAWLKAHHPARFMAAVLGNGGGFYHPSVYVSEARRMGLRVRPPCVNASEVSWTGGGDGLRTGLGQVRALGVAGATALVAEREQNGPYETLRDIVRRNEMTRPAVEALIRSGALEAVAGGRTPPELMWCWLRERAGTAAQLPLVARPEPRTGPHLAALAELETLGVCLSAHPLSLFGPWLPPDRSTAADLPAMVGHAVTLAGWPVAARPLRTGRGEPMELATFEDETGLFDAAVFPAAYRRVASRLVERRPCVVRGRVSGDRGSVSVVVQAIELVEVPTAG